MEIVTSLLISGYERIRMRAGSGGVVIMNGYGRQVHACYIGHELGFLFTTLWANSAYDKWIIIFFSQKVGVNISCTVSSDIFFLQSVSYVNPIFWEKISKIVPGC